MQMQRETALKLNQVLENLRSAEVSFRYNMENHIMNGYPIRIMDECTAKLNDTMHLGLPDAAEFPELYSYLEVKHAKAQKELEKKRKQQEFEESREGKRLRAKEKIDEIQKEIKQCTVLESLNESDLAKCKKRAEELKERSRWLYQELTQAQINFFMEFPDTS